MRAATGRLHVIAGCMSSGKTGELIRLLSRHDLEERGEALVVEEAEM